MSSFASLLRSSKFATHDPTITRIYTASTSSRAAGDWGLKYSLPPSTSNKPHSRYIRVRSLDAGQGLGCDYLSGEKEARFMQTWGSGRYGWGPSASVEGGSVHAWNRGFPQGSSGAARGNTPKKGGKMVDAEAYMQPLQVVKSKPMYIPDLEAMSEEDFEKYLEGVRGKRSGFKQRLEGNRAGSSAEGSAAKPEPINSLYEYERDGYANHTEHLHSLAEDVSSSPTSLAPQPHPTFGLAYSQGSLPDTTFSPLLSLPGRVLNSADGKAFRENNADERARERMLGNRAHATAGNREPGKIVGVGGVTAEMRNTQSEGLYEMDPVEGDPFADEDSISHFRVESAQVIRPPVIINPQAASGSARSMSSIKMLDPTGSGRSESDLAGPMREMAFKMTVSASGRTNKERLKQNQGAILPGQKGWVGGYREEINPSDHMFRAGSGAAGAGPGRRGRLTQADKEANILKGREAQATTLADIAELLAGFGVESKSASKSTSPSSPSPSQKRSYHTSAIRRNASKSDLPTANIAPGEAKGSQPIKGPGVGKPAEGDNLAEGEWRQLEENVAGEEKYGEPLDKEGKQVTEDESVGKK